jgi:hypothetical protein
MSEYVDKLNRWLMGVSHWLMGVSRWHVGVRILFPCN